jgi:putrescine transport system substrate-binding protein
MDHAAFAFRSQEAPTMRLPLSLLASALLLAGCGGNSDAPTDAQGSGDKRVVHVYNWSDYIAEDTLQRFTQATGIEVVYDVYADNETLEAKLTAGKSGYDVIFPSARPFAHRHIAAGLYAPLDKAQLPNLGNIDPAILQGLTDVDPGNAHVVPYMWGTTGIGFNVGKVREILGAEAPLDSWALLFDPTIASKLAACGIAVLDDEQEGFSAALLYAGRDPNGVGGDEVTVVEQTFAAVRPHIRYFNSSRYIDDLANGEICVAMGYSGDVLQAQARAEEAANGVEIGYIIPKEGAVRWTDVMAIPADAPHRAEAHAFINFLMQPDVIAPITDYVGYPNANLASKPLVSEAIRNDPGIYPPDDVMAKLNDPKKLPVEESDARIRAWTAIKSGS